MFTVAPSPDRPETTDPRILPRDRYVMRQALAELTVPAAATAIRRRMVYRMSALEGRSVFEFGSRGADASNEIQQLIEEVMAL